MTRRTRKNSRSSGGGGGIFATLWSPFKHLFMASGESAHKLGSTAGKIVKESMKGVEGIGSSFARHSNSAVKSVGKGVGKGVKGISKGVKGISRGVTNITKGVTGTRRKSRE
jgi:hypothetical protein